MVEDLVISSYKDQIKESLLKSTAIEKAGFSIIVEEIKRRGVDTSKIEAYFNKIKNSNTKEELDLLTVNELNNITDNINEQVTKALIPPTDISDILIRKSRTIANQVSIDGKISDDNKYIKIGSSLSNEINNHGVAKGLNLCIRNYCIQKLYQISYEEKIKEKENELGIQNTESKKEIKVSKPIDARKSKIMKDIFNRDINEDIKDDFSTIKDNYINSLNVIVNNIESYK